MEGWGINLLWRDIVRPAILVGKYRLYPRIPCLQAWGVCQLLVAATFCASGTNIFGAFNEGLSGDTTILFSKAVIDIFASIIFATRLGYPMLLITIPQFIIMGGLFFCSQFLMVFISNTMILDFISIGGLLTIILSLNMIGISIVSIVNILPALVIIFPISYLFSFIFL